MQEFELSLNDTIKVITYSRWYDQGNYLFESPS
jgi:hypothetical protein